MSPRNPLARLRTDPLIHWVGLLVAIALGGALASAHWLGLVVGGALVGLVSTTFKRALLAGVAFGVVVLCGWAGYLLFLGEFGAVVATGRFAGIAVLIGVLAPLLGSLARGVV